MDPRDYNFPKAIQLVKDSARNKAQVCITSKQIPRPLFSQWGVDTTREHSQSQEYTGRTLRERDGFGRIKISQKNSGENFMKRRLVKGQILKKMKRCSLRMVTVGTEEDTEKL